MHSHVRIYTVKYTHSHKSVTINIYCQRAHSNTKHNTDSVNAQLNTIFKTGSGKVGWNIGSNAVILDSNAFNSTACSSNNDSHNYMDSAYH